MKKLITFSLAIIIVMATTMPIMAAEEKTIFEKKSSLCKEGELSVYGRNIRENIKGEWTDCDCFDLCYCTQLYHILEDTTEDDFYTAFFNSNNFAYSLGRVYQDCSSSMEDTFEYEKNSIIKNLSPFLNEKEKDIEYVFKGKKTNLYGFLNSFDKETIGETVVNMPKEIPIIITDLWDTEKEEETFLYEGDIIFCVPYASTNTEGVLHCEDVVNNLLWNHCLSGYTFMSIYVVYTDDVIVEYSNGYHNGGEGFIRIYIP